jgi:hypothetical protein
MFYLTMEKENIDFFGTQSIMLCMGSYVLLCQLDQMLNDWELNSMCDVYNVLRLVELKIVSLWWYEKDCHLFVFQLFYLLFN